MLATTLLSSPNMVITRVSHCGQSRRAARITSVPCMSGSPRSTNKASGAIADRYAMASRAVLTAHTRATLLSRDSTSSKRARVAASSSTSITLTGVGASVPIRSPRFLP